ncbi:PepSY domain-containing protein [Shewanella sp. NIFS-20-20]|uniref:PepSY domain-containing protein n=1 Tax=Shewanella sp. NIFS-20-20 TaxID=2853806 RepID=UPI001C495E5F|nr:PepSY domain-containing protein [Shewanella sp. NIFS-20-20]MBV7314393.1 PepSY domain-containing protein [Shewanella sp. NIFS-20-20]
MTQVLKPMAIGLFIASIFSASYALADELDFTAADFNGATVSLTQAINAAQQATSAIAIDAEFDQHMGSNRYEVTLVNAKGQEIERFINPHNAEVTSPMFTDQDIDADDVAVRDAIRQGSSQPLVEIISQLESQYSAKVYKVELEQERQHISYEADLLSPEGQHIRINR